MRGGILCLVTVYIALTANTADGQYVPDQLPSLDDRPGIGLFESESRATKYSETHTQLDGPVGPNAGVFRQNGSSGRSESPSDLPSQEESWSLPRLTVPSFSTTNFSMPDYDLWSTESWLSPTQWDGSLELGLNGSEGNADALSLRTGGSAKRTTDRRDLKADLTYVKSKADGRETAHNAIFSGRDEWLLGESPWSLFLTTGLEYDEFRAFDLRLSLSSGVGYRVVDDGITKMGLRFGSGVSREFGGPDRSWVPEANFGLDYERKITEHQTFSATSDYFPQWGKFEDYRLNTTVNWEVVLDEETNMSLKLSLLDRFDSTPNGRKPNDITYSALLLWKF